MSQIFLPELELLWFEMVANEEIDERENENEKKESKKKSGVDEYILLAFEEKERNEKVIVRYASYQLLKMSHFPNVITPPPEC